MTVDRVRREMTAAELMEWAAFHRVYPLSETRIDLNAAMLCALVANALRGKGGRRYDIDDFLPFDRTRRRRRRTVQEQIAVARMLHEALKRKED